MSPSQCPAWRAQGSVDRMAQNSSAHPTLLCLPWLHQNAMEQRRPGCLRRCVLTFVHMSRK
eukprot:2850069-Heterocapsa_arctica.AAC.1